MAALRIAVITRTLKFRKIQYHSHPFSDILLSRKLNVRFSTLRSAMATLENLNFDNLVLRSLPIDPDQENRPRQVKGACFSLVDPTPVKNPETVAVSLPALQLLDLSEDETARKEFPEYFSGSKIFPGSQTASHCYCGHQFGQFAGQLGDGAAIYLGEVVNKKNERWELQLKGAGLTPYSRTADGRKVLRSSIREFLCSEAMHHLGIPTTRAAACVTSDSKVIRDIFYSGDPIEERCTVVSRIAQTFIRFGSFQICKPPDRHTGRDGPSVGRTELLEQLTDYVVKNFYPDVWSAHGNDKKTMCVEFFRQVVKRTAGLVARWQCVGWCHGVLNTDNMSIVGVTIDYGPYGFLDRYDPEFICNASDNNGRYTYENQPSVCKWNCERLAEALSLMVHMDLDCLTAVLEAEYQPEYDRVYNELMQRKFGLKNSLPEDSALRESFLSTMESTGADFTNSFRALSLLRPPGDGDHDDSRARLLEALLDQCCSLDELVKSYKPRMDPRQLQMFLMMMEMNPQLLTALGAGQRAIHDEITRLEKVKELKEKTSEQKASEDRELWTRWLDTYCERLGKDEGWESEEERRRSMNQTNPRFILRNYIAQSAIESAESGDFSEVQRVLKLLESPYSDGEVGQERTGTDDSAASASLSRPKTYDRRPPDWSYDLRVT